MYVLETTHCKINRLQRLIVYYFLCLSLYLDFSWRVGPDTCGSDHFPIILENGGPHTLERQIGKCSASVQHSLHQSAITDADDPMSLFTSVMKDIEEKTISKTSAVPKRFNKPWFTNICKDAIKERNRALERFKREPTGGNLDAYRIAGAKARRNIRHSNETFWRNYICMG